jgi:hypothetical protein
MSEHEKPTDIEPPESDVRPDSYAVRVDETHVHVWQYQITVADPEGTWQFVERLDRKRNPRLSLEQVRPKEPGADGYWLYSRSYDCTLDCE